MSTLSEHEDSRQLSRLTAFRCVILHAEAQADTVAGGHSDMEFIALRRASRVHCSHVGRANS